MEHLNKQQIILLTLLVSFVTSIATGIVTVSLMNQAPVGITQTINRVVEKTIERVTTPTNSQIVKETIVVNEDDQTVNAIDRNSKSLVRIYRTNIDPAYGTESLTLVGIGVVVTDDGIIAADNSVISDTGKYFLNSDDGKIHDLNILRAASGEQIALLKMKADDKNPLILPKVNLSAQGDLKLGQSVVFIGGETKNIVATGIVSSLNTRDVKVDGTDSSSTTSSQIKTVVVSIITTVPLRNFIPGGLLLNLSGDVVGIKSTYMDSERTDLFAPSDSIKTTLSAYADSQKKAQ